MHTRVGNLKNVQYLIWSSLLFGTTFLHSPIQIFADDSSVDPITIKPASNLVSTPVNAIDAVNSLYTSILEILTLVAGSLAVLYLVYAGIKYITSAGAPDKIKSARATITHALIGIIVISLTYTIISIATKLGAFATTIP